MVISSQHICYARQPCQDVLWMYVIKSRCRSLRRAVMQRMHVHCMLKHTANQNASDIVKHLTSSCDMAGCCCCVPNVVAATQQILLPQNTQRYSFTLSLCACVGTNLQDRQRQLPLLPLPAPPFHQCCTHHLPYAPPTPPSPARTPHPPPPPPSACARLLAATADSLHTSCCDGTQLRGSVLPSSVQAIECVLDLLRGWRPHYPPCLYGHRTSFEVVSLGKLCRACLSNSHYVTVTHAQC